MRHVSVLAYALLVLGTETTAQSRLLHAGRAGFEVTDVHLSADGRQAVFGIGDAFTPSTLYSAPMTTLGPAVLLTHHYEACRAVGSSSDVLILETSLTARTRLLRRSADGLGPVLDLAPGLSVSAFEASPDDLRVAVVGAPTGSSERRLYCAPSDASALPVEIGVGQTVASGDRPLLFSPDGARVLFRVPTSVGTNALFSAPSDASAPPVKLFAPRSGDLLVDVLSTRTRAVFVAFDAALGRRHVYSTPLDGSAPILRLSGNSGGPGTVIAGSVSLSPDGTWVCYLAEETVGVRSLFRVPSDGSAQPARVNPLLNGGDVVSAAIAPDGLRVVYVADVAVDDVFELFAAPLAGGASTRLNTALPPGGDVFDEFLFTQDSPARVVFLADQAVDDVLEIFSVPLDGSALPVRLCGSLAGPAGHGVLGFELDRQGKNVAYSAYEDSPLDLEVHLAPSDGRHPAQRLSPARPSPGEVDPFDLEASAGSVLFLYRARTTYYDLYGHAAPPVRER